MLPQPQSCHSTVHHPQPRFLTHLIVGYWTRSHPRMKFPITQNHHPTSRLSGWQVGRWLRFVFFLDPSSNHQIGRWLRFVFFRVLNSPSIHPQHPALTTIESPTKRTQTLTPALVKPTRGNDLKPIGTNPTPDSVPASTAPRVTTQGRAKRTQSQTHHPETAPASRSNRARSPTPLSRFDERESSALPFPRGARSARNNPPLIRSLFSRPFTRLFPFS